MAARLTGSEPVAVRPCSGGGNNRVFRIDTPRATFAMKWYGAIERDRDRLAQEYDGLAYLRSQHIGSAVPAPIAVDREARCAVYEWIDGTPVERHGLGDVAAVLAFLAALHATRTGPGATGLFPAAEAVFRPADLLAQIERRLNRLEPVATENPELQRFLTVDVVPEFERRSARFEAASLEVALPDAARTLSPSDFGFHNAIRKPDGTLTFIDFEYFGWDDPVKLVADFLWHPGMQLDDAERSAFARGAFDLYRDDAHFRARFDRYFPLIGIRWALIVLNEFIPEIWERRKSSGKGVDWTAAKMTQLSKARSVMAAVHSYHEAIY